MANLTDYLPAVNDGKRITQPYDPGPSIFEGLAKLGSVVQEGMAGAASTRAKREAARRQAQKDALDDSDRGAKNFAAEAILAAGTSQQSIDEAARSTPVTNTEGLNAVYDNIFKGGLSVTDPAAAKPIDHLPLTAGEIEELGKAQTTGDQIGQQAAKWQRGVSQGRISAQQYEMMLEGALREGFRMFPESKYVMLEEIKKYGVDHPIMSEYRRAEKALDEETNAQSKREEGAIDTAVTKLGMDPNLPRETLVAAGYRAQSDEFAVTQARSTWEFNTKRAEKDQATLKSVNDAHDTAVGKFVHGALAPQFGAALDQFNTIMQDKTIPEGERIKAASEFVNVFRPKAYSLIDNNLLIAVNKYGMTQETADKERTRLRSQVDDVFAQFSSDNPLNTIVTNGKILQNMKDRWQLDLQDVMPIYMRFKESFGSSDAVQALVDTVAADPQLQSVFTRELKSFQGLSQGDQTIRLKNLIAFTTDRNTTLRDYSPQESGQIIKDSANLLNNGIYRLAKNGDPSAQRTVLNTVGKVSNAAVDLNAGSSTRSLINAINIIANRESFNVINNLSPEHKEFGGLVADEMRVATGKALISLTQQKTGDPYFKWQLNDKTRRYEIVQTGTPVRSRGGGSGFMKTETFPTSGPATPTAELKAQVEAMNKGLNFLMVSTKFEDNPQLRNATFEEKYRFYTRGELPESAKPKEGSQSGRERISRLQNFWENVKVDWRNVPQVDVGAEQSRQTGRAKVNFNSDGSRSATNLAGKTVTVRSVSQLQEQHADNPIFQSLVTKASAMGIPTDVAVRLVAIETGNKFNDPGGNRAGAYGPMQVVARIHNAEAQQMFGKNVPDLTPDENIQLGLKILKDNYARHNSWLEAAHDYIGRGADDGNIRSRDYAQLVAGDDNG